MKWWSRLANVWVPQNDVTVLGCGQPSEPEEAQKDKAQEQPAEVMGHESVNAL